MYLLLRNTIKTLFLIIWIPCAIMMFPIFFLMCFLTEDSFDNAWNETISIWTHISLISK